MANARQIVNRILESDHSVVHVVEDGTSDPFTAIYVDGKLVVTNPRGDVGNLLAALGIEPQVRLVPRGFDGNFPNLLAELGNLRIAPNG